MDQREKKISSKEIFKGRILNLYVDEVQCPNGNITTREVIRHCKAACILAKLPNGKFLMEEQFRYPYDSIILEAPAGKCDGNEDPKDTALRELEEETGYRANKIKYLGLFYPSCAYTDEEIYLYYCDDLIKTKTHWDENELINIKEYSLDELKELIKNDRIKDGKTLSIILEYLVRI